MFIICILFTRMLYFFIMSFKFILDIISLKISMFTAIFSTLLNSFANIFWQKSLSFWVGGKMHDFLSYPIWIILLIILIFTGIDIGSVNFLIIIALLVFVLIDVVKVKIKQELFKKEKYSVIAPYTNLNKILIIIWSFFIFSDVSLTSLIITIIAIIVIILFTIDLKTLKLPRNFKKVLIVEVIDSISWLFVGWFIISYSEKLFFSMYVVISTIIVASIVLYLWEHKTVKWVPKQFWLFRYIWWLGWVSRFLWLTVIKSMWLSISILLSFLWIGAALFFSYIFMKDIPAKKDILLTVIVTALVGLGFYFK